MKQTAVEWLVEQMDIKNPNWLKEEIEQAKEMEKQQIIEAFDDGWKRANDTKDKAYATSEDFGNNYYNETFKNK